MIIRIGKFEVTVVLTLLLTFSFFATLITENKVATVSTSNESVRLPVIMYHHITEKIDKAGKYTVLTTEFENDLEHIKNNGYTTVTVSDLIDYVNNGTQLPEKPIMITFDDGFESFYHLAYPLLKKYNMKAVLSVIGSVTEKYSAINDHNINYSNLTWEQITELHKSKFVEIQNHSYDMHKNDSDSRKGLSKRKNESEENYASALKVDLMKLQSLLYKKCGFEPTAVAYPYGSYSKTTTEIVKSCGFSCTLICEERINHIEAGNPDSLYNLGRFNRASGIKTVDFFRKLI